MIRRIIFKLMPFVLIIAGLFFGYLGYTDAIAQSLFTGTEAVIKEIRVEYDDANTDNTRYDVYVTYDVEGVHYTSELGEYDASMREGMKIDIAYNPNNPRQIVKKGYLSMVIRFGMALLAIAAAVLVGLRNRKES